MKKIKIYLLSILFCFFLSNVTFAGQWRSLNIPNDSGSSTLLAEEVLSSKDSVKHYGRGDYLAEGSVQITNLEDGRLRINATTLAHVNVDRILHSVFLDMWDEDENDWIPLEYWDFEITKEEVENEELYMLATSFILSGYEVGRYYRLRGLHGVEIYDELEACATETHGVLLTDLWN